MLVDFEEYSVYVWLLFDLVAWKPHTHATSLIQYIQTGVREVNACKMLRWTNTYIEAHTQTQSCPMQLVEQGIITFML